MKEPYLSIAGMEVSERAPALEALAGSIKAVQGDVTVRVRSNATDAGHL